MKIRKFKKEDAKKVSYLIRKTMQYSLIKCYSKKVVDELCKANTPSRFIERSKTRDYYLAVEGDKILGINGIKGNEVKTVFVDPISHGKGIGKLLMKNIENIAKKRGIKELEVHSSLIAESFYKRVGFRRIKRTMNKVGIIKFPDILMKKKI